jgi:hypothetical protein
MSAKEEDRQEGLIGPRTGAKPPGDDPTPCGEEAPRSAFSSGLSKLLLGVGITAVAGAAVLTLSSRTAGAPSRVQLAPPPGAADGNGGVVGDISGPDVEQNHREVEK